MYHDYKEFEKKERECRKEVQKALAKMKKEMLDQWKTLTKVEFEKSVTEKFIYIESWIVQYWKNWKHCEDSMLDIAETLYSSKIIDRPEEEEY